MKTLLQIQTEARELAFDTYLTGNPNLPDGFDQVIFDFIDRVASEAYQLGKDAAIREINQGMFDLLKEAGREDIIQKALEQARSV